MLNKVCGNCDCHAGSGAVFEHFVPQCNPFAALHPLTKIKIS